MSTDLFCFHHFFFLRKVRSPDCLSMLSSCPYSTLCDWTLWIGQPQDIHSSPTRSFCWNIFRCCRSHFEHWICFEPSTDGGYRSMCLKQLHNLIITAPDGEMETPLPDSMWIVSSILRRKKIAHKIDAEKSDCMWIMGMSRRRQTEKTFIIRLGVWAVIAGNKFARAKKKWKDNRNVTAHRTRRLVPHMHFNWTGLGTSFCLGPIGAKISITPFLSVAPP